MEFNITIELQLKGTNKKIINIIKYTILILIFLKQLISFCHQFIPMMHKFNRNNAVSNKIHFKFSSQNLASNTRING